MCVTTAWVVGKKGCREKIFKEFFSYAKGVKYPEVRGKHLQTCASGNQKTDKALKNGGRWKKTQKKDTEGIKRKWWASQFKF